MPSRISAQFAAHLGSTGVAVTSVLARWELFRVFARKEGEGALTAGAAEALFARFESDVVARRIDLLPMNAAVEKRFHGLTLHLHRSTPPTFARTLDAIHLATADVCGATEIVATDNILRKCATAIGLKVFP